LYAYGVIDKHVECESTRKRDNTCNACEITKTITRLLLVGQSDDPKYWIKIASAWQHQDDQDFNLRLSISCRSIAINA
jgi:hypothetical protein